MNFNLFRRHGANLALKLILFTFIFVSGRGGKTPVCLFVYLFELFLWFRFSRLHFWRQLHFSTELQHVFRGCVCNMTDRRHLSQSYESHMNQSCIYTLFSEHTLFRTFCFDPDTDDDTETSKSINPRHPGIFNWSQFSSFCCVLFVMNFRFNV